MKASKIKINSTLSDILFISAITSIIFIFTVFKVNKVDFNTFGGTHSWLTGSTVKFTNNWLNDGIVEDKFAMLEKPLSIESPKFEDRKAYLSYPSGTIGVSYVIAKLANQDVIGSKFVKIMSIIFYGLDGLLIAILFYLILNYIFKIKSRVGKIFLPILLSSLWMLIPNNVYYLKNVFFSDQLVLFFTCLLVVLEVLRNYCNITNRAGRITINILIFLTILTGVLTDYYFWIQVLILCLINFTASLAEKNGFINSLKKILIYVIPALLALGLFALQLMQINNWFKHLKWAISYRSGMSVDVSDCVEIAAEGSYIKIIISHIYFVLGYVGFAILILFTLGSLIVLCGLKIRRNKNRQNDKSLNDIFKISLLIIVPAFAQLLVLSNHSAVHEFSILKLNFPFVFGFLLASYVIFTLAKQSLNSIFEITFGMNNFNRKISMNSYILLTTLLVILYPCFNIYPDKSRSYSKNLKTYYDSRYHAPGYTLEFMISEMNEYENVFFSFTESIRTAPPHSIAISRKMVYQVNDLADTKSLFWNLSDEARLFFIINKNNTSKDDLVVSKENFIMENYPLVAETEGYAVFSLNENTH